MTLKWNFILSILSLIIFNLSSVAQTWTQVGSDIDGEAAGDRSGSFLTKQRWEYRGYWSPS